MEPPSADQQPGPAAEGHVEQPTPMVQNFNIIVQLPPAPPAIRRIDISNPETFLGKGSYGTVVLRGSFEGRTVAVKRTVLNFVTLIERDVSALQAAGGHPNVMQYYHHETDYDHLHIAFELCPATLANVFDRPDEFRDAVDALALEPKATLRQITAGLHHLHSLNIIHCDVKPQNILMAPVAESTQTGPGLRWLFSDFGFRKKYEYNRKRLRFPNSSARMRYHTLGWRAPELIREELEYDDPEAPPDSPPAVTGWLTKAVDIFALGCLYYYVLMGGRLHAFGDLFRRQWNILHDYPRLKGLEGDKGEEARALIERMLRLEVDERPDTSTCLMHPYFWDDGQRLAFLLHAWEPFRTVPLDSAMEGSHEILGPDQYSQLDELFIEHLDEFRKCEGKSVQDVFNTLRVSNVTLGTSKTM